MWVREEKINSNNTTTTTQKNPNSEKLLHLDLLLECKIYREKHYDFFLIKSSIYKILIE